jgi:type II secretory pathway component PulK
MRNKSQVVIISLWILVILALLAVGIGHRVSLGLRLFRYQKDGLKAACLAKAGVNRVIELLEKDTDGYDAPDAAWADNREALEKISLEEEGGDYAAVSYFIPEGSSQRQVFGIEDEEKKFSLNAAPRELLVLILKNCGFDDTRAEGISDYIRIWRGDDDPALNAQAQEYRNFKKEKFSVPEELLAVLEYYYLSEDDADYIKKAKEGFERLTALLSVYPQELKLNANTAGEPALNILAEFLAETDEQRDYLAQVVRDIIAQRAEKNYFKVIGDIEKRDVAAATTDDDNLYDSLVDGHLSVNSDYFKIQAAGHSGRLNKKICAVYHRPAKRIVFWHER